MGTDYKINKLYSEAVRKAASGQAQWKEVCRLTGQLYRYEFDNILLISIQRPGTTLAADFDTWKKVGRYVKRGSKGIAIFPSRALKPEMRYVFDISDTAGKKQKLTWELDNELAAVYAEYLRNEGIWEGSPDTAGNPAEKESDLNLLKAFTENRIRVIMKSEFADRINGFTDSMGKRGKLAAELIECSIMYAVFSRCGFDIPPRVQDLSLISEFTAGKEISRLGVLVSDISCEVLRGIANDLKQAKERSTAYGRNNADIPRGGGRDALPKSGASGGEGTNGGAREVRTEGGGVSEGEPQRPLQNAGAPRHAGRDGAGSGEGSIPHDGASGDRLFTEKSPGRPAVHDGNVAVKKPGENAGRGDRNVTGRDEVPLKENLPDEILPEEEKGSFKQASFLDAHGRRGEIYAAWLPASGAAVRGEGHSHGRSIMDGSVGVPGKAETVLTVPRECVRFALMSDSGFSYGKRRIYELFHKLSDPIKRTEAVRKLYGQADRSMEWNGAALGYDTYHSGGMHFTWYEDGVKKEGHVGWNSIERELQMLVSSGEYYTPPADFDPDRVSTALWQEPADQFFNGGFWLSFPNIALKEVVQQDIPPQRQGAVCGEDIHRQKPCVQEPF